ncbi:MAG TPA: 4-hydroxy-3-methylbut-2-enyl diphosphate reductase, partial [Bacteroidales bacterium]|nr:4-hydroxy-3-methylbut-2-enyl diphosphate reductase [Bacteroidales bacterium]
MEILIDASAGCCPGVVKAIRKAEQAIGEGRPLLSLGQIVHNEREAERLQKQGMRTVLHVDEGDAAGYMLIRAHGEPPSTYAALDAGKRPYIDATCPVVLRLQRKVGEAALRMEKSGGYVLLFA